MLYSMFVALPALLLHGSSQDELGVAKSATQSILSTGMHMRELRCS